MTHLLDTIWLLRGEVQFPFVYYLIMIKIALIRMSAEETNERGKIYQPDPIVILAKEQNITNIQSTREIR